MLQSQLKLAIRNQNNIIYFLTPKEIFNFLINIYILNMKKIRQSFIILVVLYSFITFVKTTAPIWSSSPSIESGHLNIYITNQLVNNVTGYRLYTKSLTITTITTANALLTVGITSFHIPPTIDFSLNISNRVLSSTNIEIGVQIKNQTIIKHLELDYLIMINSNLEFQMYNTGKIKYYSEFKCLILSKGILTRSEQHITASSSSNPFFSTTNLKTVLVLSGFMMSSLNQSYYYLKGQTKLPSPGIFNTTFITAETTKVSWIKYSLIFYNQILAQRKMKNIFQIGIMQFKNSVDSAFYELPKIQSRYLISKRTFFGICEFNFTYSGDKQFTLETSTAPLTNNYKFTSTLYQITLSYYFFVQQSCASGFFLKNNDPALDDCVSACSGSTSRAVENIALAICDTCHHSCKTCLHNSANSCDSCDASAFRTLAAPLCNCNVGFVDVGVKICSKCSDLITGCATCSSATVCSTCLSGFTGPPPCKCNTPSKVVTGFCTSVVGCISVSIINGTEVCTACDANHLFILKSDFTCQCSFGSTFDPITKTCSAPCGDGHYFTPEECDDGNLVDGDGCSSSCKIEPHFSCLNSISSLSICKINQIVTFKYVGTIRNTGSNSAILYFQLYPQFKQLEQISFNGLLNTNLTFKSSKVQYVPAEYFFKIYIDYSQDVESLFYSFQLQLSSTIRFWNDTYLTIAKVNGVNCQITYDSELWINSKMKYLFISLIVLTILVFIISIFYEKWIGLEHIQVYQSQFFLCSYLNQYPFEFTPIYETLKYSNGYNDILPNDYYRTYTLSNPINAMAIDKQFISNYNILFILQLILLVILIILSYAKNKIAKQKIDGSIKDQEKQQKINKIFTFIFSNIFLMLVFFSMFKIIFCFGVQLSNQFSNNQIFPDELNVVISIIAFFIVLAAISYILFWYLLLPANFKQEQTFMNLSFQNMNFYYPVFYLVYQTIFILIISIFFAFKQTIYLILTIEIIYAIILILTKSYTTFRKLNRVVHNFTIIFNQIIVIFFTVIIIRWNSIVGTGYHVSSNYELTVYLFVIFLLLLISTILAIIRLAMFNKEVKINCCKKSIQEVEQITYQTMKKANKNQKDAEGDNRIKYFQEKQQTAPKAKVKKYRAEQFEINERFLNDQHISWNRQKSNKKQVMRQKKKIKVSIQQKTAIYKKSPLEQFIEAKMIKNNQGDGNYKAKK